jgi:hypothetical protein
MTDQAFDGVFAMLDVLGFRRRMDTVPLEDLRDTVVGALVSSALTAELLVNHDRSRAGYPSEGLLRWAFFSDTVVLWLPSEERRAKSALASITYTCQVMLAKAMWLNVPLRGAIAYGRCIVSPDPVYYLGKPILEAHDIEQRQQWAGVVLCESASALVDDLDSVRAVRWDVPLKAGTYGPGTVPKSMLAVDWPLCSMGPRHKALRADGTQDADDGASPDWNACFDSESGDVLAKKDATIAFFEDRQRNGGAFGTIFGPEQRDLVRRWRDLYNSGR